MSDLSSEKRHLAHLCTVRFPEADTPAPVSHTSCKGELDETITAAHFGAKLVQQDEAETLTQTLLLRHFFQPHMLFVLVLTIRGKWNQDREVPPDHTTHSPTQMNQCFNFSHVEGTYRPSTHAPNVCQQLHP